MSHESLSPSQLPESRNQILEQMLLTINSSPEEQKAFISFLFETMSIEGEANITNARDAAQAILSHPEINPLLQKNKRIIWSAYARAIKKQDFENDPFSGSIATLLEVGQLIASTVKTTKKDINRINGLWQIIAQDMVNEDEKEIIKTQSGKIYQTATLFSSRKYGPREKNINLDNEVEKLSKQGLGYKEMTEILNVTPGIIRSSRERLIKQKRIEKMKAGRKPKQETVELARKMKKVNRNNLDNQVEKLSKKGLGGKEITEALNVSLIAIRGSRQRLLKQKRVERMKTGRKPKQETVELDKQVRKLSKKDLGYKEMAEILNVAVSEIINSQNRLLRQGKKKIN